MAIDPTISLGVQNNNTDMAGSVNNAAIMAQNIQKAQLAQVQAISATRELAAKQLLGAHGEDIKSPNGEGIDFVKATGILNNGGYADMVPALMTPFINQAKSTTDSREAQLKTEQQAAGILAQHQLQQEKDGVAPEVRAQNYTTDRQGLLKILGPTVISDKLIPQAVDQSTGEALMGPKEISSWANSTLKGQLNAQEDKSLQIAQQQADIAVRSLNMDSGKVAVQAQQNLNTAGALLNGADTYKALGLDSVKIKNYAKTQIDKLISSDPKWAMLQHSIDQYNASHLGETPLTIYTPGIDAVLRKESIQQNMIGNQMLKAAQSGYAGKNAPQAAAQVQAQPISGNPIQPSPVQPQVQVMSNHTYAINVNGQLKYVTGPENEVMAAHPNAKLVR